MQNYSCKNTKRWFKTIKNDFKTLKMILKPKKKVAAL